MGGFFQGSIEKANKIFCIVLTYSYLFAMREGTHVRKNSNVFGFLLTYSYLFPYARRYSRSKKLKCIWFFAHLFVPLQAL